jgi:hypothetical protein
MLFEDQEFSMSGQIARVLDSSELKSCVIGGMCRFSESSVFHSNLHLCPSVSQHWNTPFFVGPSPRVHQ